MIGTPANLEILREAGVLGAEGEAAGAGDIVIALRAKDAASADAALAEARPDDGPAAATAGAAPGVAAAHAALGARSRAATPISR